VRELYAPGGAGEAAALELFGPEVLGADGRVDRARIARLVFSDPERRHRLEARIHPLVRAERARRFAEAQRRGADVVVVEASQLLEAKSEPEYDRVLLVIAPETSACGAGSARGATSRTPADASRDRSRLPRLSIGPTIASSTTVRSKTCVAKSREVYRSWRA
jgi:dephospho-CoA kinase